MENFMLRVWGLPETSKPPSTASKHQWRELIWAGRQPGPTAAVLPLELLRQDTCSAPVCQSKVTLLCTQGGVQVQRQPWAACLVFLAGFIYLFIFSLIRVAGDAAAMCRWGQAALFSLRVSPHIPF